jgi:sulfite reductase beta subunit-like hemoprotein
MPSGSFIHSLTKKNLIFYQLSKKSAQQLQRIMKAFELYTTNQTMRDRRASQKYQETNE